jgi:hypothetical protein
MEGSSLPTILADDAFCSYLTGGDRPGHPRQGGTGRNSLTGRAVTCLALLLPASRSVTTLLIRCAIWALIGWLLSLHPAVSGRARHALSDWRSAWKVEAPACGVRAYGLRFRADDCRPDPP